MNKDQYPTSEEIIKVCPGTENYEYINHGGFKIVYKATTNSGLIEAIKVVKIPEDHGDDEIRIENINRNNREISLLGKCKSPFLVKLGSIEPFEVKIKDISYIIYSEEFIDGNELVIDKTKRPSISELANLGICLLTAIDELRSLRIVHRDIKPRNIMTSSDPMRSYILLDLGIAFVINDTNYTRGLLGPGTRNYAAPELLNSNYKQELDYRADLYATGLVLFEFATGINPFVEKGNPNGTLTNILTLTPVPLNNIRNDLDKDFCELIDQFLKKQPALRPKNIKKSIELFEGLK